MIHIQPTAPGQGKDQSAPPGGKPAFVASPGFPDHKCTIIDSGQRETVESELTHHVIGIQILGTPEVHHRNVGNAGVATVEGVEYFQPAGIYGFAKGSYGVFHVPAKTIVADK